jgi:hypothetical protein
VLAAERLERAERALLVGSHQPAIAGDIRAYDCRQPPVRVLRHRATLAGASFFVKL